MRPRTFGFTAASLAGAIAFALAALTGCSSTATPKAAANPGVPAAGQQQFDTDAQAAAALVAAAKTRDHEALARLFGPAAPEFISGNKAEDTKAFDRFTQNAAEHLQLEKKNAATSIVDIGKDNWPFPIPITRLADGKWFFDTAAGKQEMRARRIGRDELETIKVCRAYGEAQRQYASADRDGSGVYKYAQHFISRNGKDGLYWPAAPGEEESPFGEMLAQASMSAGSGPKPYCGYFYHILTCQGPDAPGGRYSYIINGNMIAGFALVACPSEYGKSGVMTFIISHQGELYQKDLGPDTLKIVRSMKEYNPDSTWSLVGD